MTETIHLDTNVIILAMGGDRRLSTFIQGKHPVISEVVEMELLCYPVLHTEEDSIREFLVKARIQPIDERIKREAIRIRRTFRLKLLDAIVAATAKVDQRSLLTAYLVFKRISEEQGIIYYQVPRP